MWLELTCLVFLPLLVSPRTETASTRTVTPQDSIKYSHLDEMNSEQIPVFGNMTSNITVQREGTAFLHCPVKNPGDRPVSYPLISWVRIRDWHILTNGLVRFTTDDRFNVLYKEGSFNWILQIKYTQDRDAGIYECQGGEEYHVDAGSPIALTCVIESTPSQPQYVFWYHNERMVNYDTERGVQVSTSSVDGRTESKLTISKAGVDDRGNYTCSPSNSAPATVQLFVTKRNSVNADPLKPQAISKSLSLSPHLIFDYFMVSVFFILVKAHF